MKRIGLFAGTIAVLALGSCKEKGPLINFGNTTASDTTYLAAVETAKPRNVLVEEFTGADCTNCPAAAVTIENIAAQPDKIGRINVISMHIKKNGVIFGPVIGKSKYVFQTDKGTQLADLVYPGIGSIPVAGIDRVSKGGSTILDKSDWASIINSQLALASNANMNVTSSYDPGTKTATIVVTVAYTKAVTAKQFLTVAITQDSMIDWQAKPGEEDSVYEFSHTLRDVLTGVGGDEILSKYATKEAGRVYMRTFKYTLGSIPKWPDGKPENFHIIAILNNNDGSDKTVQQSVQTALK
ncbi:MAG: Omp28-related outer membrane protein [Bacteroidetes bacterium]|nr:Omp28-related outer membrane protein [Bacteroidota bacterium]